MFLRLVIFLFLGCSIGGGDKVIDYGSFKDKSETISVLALGNCLNKYNYRKSSQISDNNSTQNTIPIEAVWVQIFSGSNEVLSINKRYVLKKDAEFCYSSLLYTPCGNDLGNFLLSITYNYMNYCSVKTACFYNKSNFGQGNLCVN